MTNTTMKAFGVSNRIGHDSTVFYGRKMYQKSSVSEAKLQEASPVCDDIVNRIYQHSSEDMHELPDNSVHLMVTSPPYNVGKEYDDDLSMNDYMDLLNSVWRETYRVLAPGGRACINVANIGRKPYLPLNTMITASMVDIGFLMRGEIIWNKAASAGVSCAWGSWCSASNPVLRDIHEYIMVFSKDRYNRSSKNKEATITRDEFIEYTKSIWMFKTESAKRVNHPAPYPVELPRRLMQLYTFKNDIVLDPFIGSGTTAVAAVELGRRYIGYDISAEYVATTQRRLSKQNESLFA